MWLDRYGGRLLLAASITVHVCVLTAVHRGTGRIDSYVFKSLDCGEYYRIARNVADHGVFSWTPSPPLEPDTWRTPGYSLFLAVAMLLLGDSPSMLVVVQQAFCVLNVWLLFRIARQLMTNRRAAIVAFLFLLEPYHLYYSLWLMSTTLFTTALLLLWRAWQKAIDRRTPLWFGAVGLLSGSLVLIRPLGILVPLALLLGLIRVTVVRRREYKPAASVISAWCTVGVFVFGCALVVGSWMVRNRVVAGHFALSDQGGVVLAYFKATEVILWRQGRTAERYMQTSLDPSKADLPHTVWDRIDAQLRDRFPDATAEQLASLQWRNLAQGNRATLDSFEVSKALRRIGLSRLLESPVSTIACCVARCGSILTFPLNLVINPATGVEGRRLRCAMLALPYVALCAAVMIRLARRLPARGQVYFPLACTTALLLATTPQIDPRFRVPMIPLLALLAMPPKR